MTWREFLVLGILLALIVSTHWFTVNISPSIPVGLYRYLRTPAPFQRGELIRIPAVDFGRSWPQSWLPLLKPVAGVPGDTVCVKAEGLWVTERQRDLDGEERATSVAYGPVYQEHKGQPLPVFWGCHAVEDGEVFVASHEPKSLDGRYFGLTRAEDALKVVSVWIWR